MHNKRVIVDHYGGPEVITVAEEGIPTPKPGEVRVKVLAAGVGLPDIADVSQYSVQKTDAQKVRQQRAFCAVSQESQKT